MIFLCRRHRTIDRIFSTIRCPNVRVACRSLSEHNWICTCAAVTHANIVRVSSSSLLCCSQISVIPAVHSSVRMASHEQWNLSKMGMPTLEFVMRDFPSSLFSLVPLLGCLHLSLRISEQTRRTRTTAESQQDSERKKIWLMSKIIEASRDLNEPSIERTTDVWQRWLAFPSTSVSVNRRECHRRVVLRTLFSRAMRREGQTVFYSNCFH